MRVGLGCLRVHHQALHSFAACAARAAAQRRAMIHDRHALKQERQR